MILCITISAILIGLCADTSVNASESLKLQLEFTFQPQKLYCLSDETVHEYDVSAPPTFFDEQMRDFLAFGGLVVDVVVSSDGTIVSSEWKNYNIDDSSGTIDASAKGTTRLELISINGKPVKK